MFLIIWGHFFPPHMSKFIYSINVPLFFFISGYLFKDSDTKTLLGKIVRSLAVPYLILASFNLSIHMGLGFLEIDGFSRFGRTRLPRAIIGILTGCHSVQGVPAAEALWFVYDLIIIKIVTHFVSRYDLVKYATIAVMLGASLYISGFNEPILAITPFRSLPIAYLFFEFGRMIKYNKVVFSSITKLAKITLALCIVPIYYLSVRGNGVAYIFLGSLGNSTLMFFISSISAILICILVFQSITFRQKQFIYISSIGTIITLAIHGWMVLLVVNHFLIKCESISWKYTIISMIWALVILVLCYFMIIITKRFFPVILGRRR